MDKNLYDNLVDIAHKRFEAIQGWITSPVNKRPIAFGKIERNQLFFSIGFRNLLIEYFVVHKKQPEYKVVLKAYELEPVDEHFGQLRKRYLEGQDIVLTFFDDNGIAPHMLGQYLLGIQNCLDSI